MRGKGNGSASTGFAQRAATLLIVDDHDAMRLALRMLVQRAFRRLAIHEAIDGAQALAKCFGLNPRLVLMDIDLPEANGIELAARIRSKLPGTEVIVLSLFADSLNVERSIAAGARAFVAKSELHVELLPAIESALSRGSP